MLLASAYFYSHISQIANGNISAGMQAYDQVGKYADECTKLNPDHLQLL
jgi:hypothetical protein